MISRIVARLMHSVMFIITAGTCACLYAELIITSRVKKNEGSHYDFSWLTYYLLVISALGALQTLLWIFQSRIYENGRPSVQECVLTGLFTLLFLFAAAWQFYQTFANQSPNEFICPTDFYDETVHCRLWQTQLVGCAVCGVMFLLATILFIILFRSRPLVFKDLPEDFITSSPITAPSSLERDETQKREHEEAEAIAAEAERRRLEQRQQQQIQQQQQMQRPMPQPRPSQPYQQHLYQTKRVVPGQLQHQGSNGYLNQQMTHQNSSGYLNQQYPPRISPQPQDPRMSVDNGNYYNSNYAAQRQHTSFDMSVPVTSAGYQNNLPLVTPLGAGGYSEEPSSYMDTSVDPNAQYQGYPDYAYGQFNPTETFDDPTSQEAQAHLAYANQLKEQQLYHQNMAEVLQKQQQQKLLKQQQLQQQDSRAPASGSTVDFYPPPPRHNSSIHLPPNTMAPSTSRVTARPSSKGGFNHPYATGATQNYDTGMVTPGSNSGTRLAGSPQHFPDNVTVTESHYSDDRYKADLIDEIRRARLEDSQENNPVEYEDYHDYKVQIASEYGGGSRPSSRNRVHGPAYVPPPNAGTSRS